jgi:hypothetical protein
MHSGYPGGNAIAKTKARDRLDMNTAIVLTRNRCTGMPRYLTAGLEELAAVAQGNFEVVAAFRPAIALQYLCICFTW